LKAAPIPRRPEESPDGRPISTQANTLRLTANPPYLGLAVDEKQVLKNEPLSRAGGSKPHWAEVCYRTGGETVWVCSRYPNGVNEHEYKRLWRTDKSIHGLGWRVMRRNPEVYVKGRIRHADHATVTLHVWHRVLMNTRWSVAVAMA
jgi:hypothetical protein